MVSASLKRVAAESVYPFAVFVPGESARGDPRVCAGRGADARGPRAVSALRLPIGYRAPVTARGEHGTVAPAYADAVRRAWRALSEALRVSRKAAGATDPRITHSEHLRQAGTRAFERGIAGEPR